MYAVSVLMSLPKGDMKQKHQVLILASVPLLLMPCASSNILFSQLASEIRVALFLSNPSCCGSRQTPDPSEAALS